jgi:hypothetical protein
MAKPGAGDRGRISAVQRSLPGWCVAQQGQAADRGRSRTRYAVSLLHPRTHQGGYTANSAAPPDKTCWYYSASCRRQFVSAVGGVRSGGAENGSGPEARPSKLLGSLAPSAGGAGGVKLCDGWTTHVHGAAACRADELRDSLGPHPPGLLDDANAISVRKRSYPGSDLPRVLTVHQVVSSVRGNTACSVQAALCATLSCGRITGLGPCVLDHDSLPPF